MCNCSIYGNQRLPCRSSRYSAAWKPKKSDQTPQNPDLPILEIFEIKLKKEL
jgi:hypothetical protein